MNEEQAKELRQASQASRDGPLRTRCLAVRLYGSGYSLAEVMQITGCSRTSLMDWRRRYKKAGVAGLIDQRTGGNRAKLTSEQIEELKKRLNRCDPAEALGREQAGHAPRLWTVDSLMKAIEKWFHVRYESRSSYLRLFDLCGFSYKRSSGGFRPKTRVKPDEGKSGAEGRN
ncbi:MAG: helix-turn-helix domain-containing protein [Syntrophobacteraceae bacterium]|nr:helix-turn-helix domain-containing protein [Desulfobacteraceae bacterium]